MGRRKVITAERWADFMESVSEELKDNGYLKIAREVTNPKTGGLNRRYLGYIAFDPDDDYNSLRGRVKDMAEKTGPGLFLAIPCGEDKKEIKGQGVVKFEFTDTEVDDMTQPSDPSEGVNETMNMMKKMQKSALDMNKMEFQQKFFNKILGVEEKKEKEEEAPVQDSNDPLNTIMMMKMLGNDDKKGDERTERLLEKLVESQSDKGNDRIERLLERLVENQAKPQGEGRMERLLERLLENQMQPQNSDKADKLMEKLLEKSNSEKQENAFQSMMALMIKQQEERDRVRQEDQKRQEDREREERRMREESRKEERLRIEEAAKLEREKFEKTIEDQRHRFNEEMRLRREEMKSEEEKNRRYGQEQQKFQLQLLDIFKNNKDTGLEMTSKIVGSLTSAGLSSMQTAQSAAETIMSIARKAGDGGDSKKSEEEEGGFGKTLKDIASIATPLLAPYADADAKLGMLKSAGAIAGQQQGPDEAQQQAMAQQQAAQYQQALAQQQAQQEALARQQQAQAQQQAMARQQAAQRAAAKRTQPKPTVPASPTAPSQRAPEKTEVTSSTTTPKTTYTQNASTGLEEASAEKPTKGYEGAGMIAQYLRQFPILKHAIIGNLKDNLGVEVYLPIVTGIGQPTLEGLIANLPPSVVMDEVKQVCTEDEQKLVDANAAWFDEFRKTMIEELKAGDEEDEDEVEETEEPKAETSSPK